MYKVDDVEHNWLDSRFYELTHKNPSGKSRPYAKNNKAIQIRSRAEWDGLPGAKQFHGCYFYYKLNGIITYSINRADYEARGGSKKVRHSINVPQTHPIEDKIDLSYWLQAATFWPRAPKTNLICQCIFSDSPLFIFHCKAAQNRLNNIVSE